MRKRTAKYKFTGRPCRNGHIGERYSNGNCVTCLLSREANFYRNDPEFKKQKKQLESDRYKTSLLRRADANMRGQRKRLICPEQQPSWSHDEDLLKIYLRSAQKSLKTGNKYVVDHIIPLKGRRDGIVVVCGLHTPNNLRVVTHKTNALKSFTIWPEM